MPSLAYQLHRCTCRLVSLLQKFQDPTFFFQVPLQVAVERALATHYFRNTSNVSGWARVRGRGWEGGWLEVGARHLLAASVSAAAGRHPLPALPAPPTRHRPTLPCTPFCPTASSAQLAAGWELGWDVSSSMFAHPTTNSLNIVGQVSQLGGCTGRLPRASQGA